MSQFIKRSNKNMIFEIGGYIGMVIILVAFIANTFQITNAESPSYLLANVIGALLLGIDFFRKKAFAGLILEIVWGGVALISFGKILFL